MIHGFSKIYGCLQFGRFKGKNISEESSCKDTFTLSVKLRDFLDIFPESYLEGIVCDNKISIKFRMIVTFRKFTIMKFTSHIKMSRAKWKYVNLIKLSTVCCCFLYVNAFTLKTCKTRDYTRKSDSILSLFVIHQRLMLRGILLNCKRYTNLHNFLSLIFFLLWEIWFCSRCKLFCVKLFFDWFYLKFSKQNISPSTPSLYTIIILITNFLTSQFLVAARLTKIIAKEKLINKNISKNPRNEISILSLDFPYYKSCQISVFRTKLNKFLGKLWLISFTN